MKTSRMPKRGVCSFLPEGFTNVGSHKFGEGCEGAFLEICVEARHGRIYIDRRVFLPPKMNISHKPIEGRDLPRSGQVSTKHFGPKYISQPRVWMFRSTLLQTRRAATVSPVSTAPMTTATSVAHLVATRCVIFGVVRVIHS